VVLRVVIVRYTGDVDLRVVLRVVLLVVLRMVLRAVMVRYTGNVNVRVVLRMVLQVEFVIGVASGYGLLHGSR
jgi:hypothetical protein